MKIEIMKDELKRYEALLEAWKNVEIVTKKDGMPFSCLKRNFKNCTFVNKYGLQHMVVSIRKDIRVYSDDLVIYKKRRSVEVITVKKQIDFRIKMLEKSAKTWKEAIDIIENNTIDVNRLAKIIMDDVKEMCNGNTMAISHYKFALMEELKKY